MSVTTPRLGYKANDTARANDKIKSVLDPLLAQKLSSAKTLPGIAVTANTVVTVAHGLGRAYTGYEVVRQTAGTGLVQLIEQSVTGLDMTKQIALLPTATGTITLRVF